MRRRVRGAAYNPGVSHLAHKAEAPAAVGCFVLTVSDTRTPETDKNKHYIEARMAELGHIVAAQFLWLHRSIGACRYS
mgnify:CR=1 FL=1